MHVCTLHKCSLQLYKLPGLGLYRANTRGLPIGGYFVPYQQGIQCLQRWRPMHVALKMISTNKSVVKGASHANWTPVKRPPIPKSFGLPMPACAQIVWLRIAARRAIYAKREHYSRACCTAAQPSHMLLLRLLANCAPTLSALVSPCSFLAAINFSSTIFLHGRSEACVCTMHMLSIIVDTITGRMENLATLYPNMRPSDKMAVITGNYYNGEAIIGCCK